MTSKLTNTQTTVFCTTQLDGTHNWPECPFDEVAYLRDPHRHMFHIKATKIVTHTDRDTEFIMLKHQVIEYLRNKYYNNLMHCYEFGAMSCEMIASELFVEFGLIECEVSEDGENGATVTFVLFG